MPTEQSLSSEQLHADRWSAELQVKLCLPGQIDQSVRLTNFSTWAVRIVGVRGLVEGGKASLKIGTHPAVEIRVVWIADTMAGCRFITPPDPAAYQMIVDSATGIDRTVMTQSPCSKILGSA